MLLMTIFGRRFIAGHLHNNQFILIYQAKLLVGLMNYRAASYAVSKHSITANLQTTLFAPGTLAYRSFLDF